MPTYRAGRHENGQNYLTDHSTIGKFTQLVAQTRGPIVEIGPGRGALTRRLHALGRPLTAVEIDPRSVAFLRRSLGVEVVNADFLSWRLPAAEHVVVGNVPFHLTTAILRKLLHQESWSAAVLLVQWEVARRRAGVGGATMMTAQWWPWFDFGLGGRVSRHALRPAPSVDGGLLVMTRRPEPLIAPGDRDAYRDFVHKVFTGKGYGVPEILANVARPADRRAARRWASQAGVQPNALPKDLAAKQWVQLFNLSGRS
ncbi:23S ribosomal RNA methyltransferase Erm [Kribbella sp. WER1]